MFSKINKLFVVLLMSSPAMAQQNFFNVPSSDITKKSEIYIQEQLNLGTTEVYSNFTWVYGLGNHFEVGFNIFDVGTKYQSLRLISNSQNDSLIYSPAVLINAQKKIDLNEAFHLSLGTQMGTNIQLQPGVSKLINFNYLNLKYRVEPDFLTFVFGFYYANQAYRGNEGAGFLLGTEIPILLKKFHIIVDYVSGQSPISVSVIGGCYFFADKTLLSFGFQPAINGNDNGAVLEFTLSD